MKYILLFIFVILLMGLQSQSGAQSSPVSDFSLPSLDGQTFALKDALGQKIIVLNFWAAWCTTCAEEMPLLLELKNKYADRSDVAFVGINVGDSSRAAQRFVDSYKYSYTILLDANKAVAKLYQVTGIPQTIVISKTGEISFRGARPPSEL